MPLRQIRPNTAVIGYFGSRAATTKGLMRTWLHAELRVDRPPSKRLKASAAAGEGTSAK